MKELQNFLWPVVMRNCKVKRKKMKEKGEIKLGSDFRMSHPPFYDKITHINRLLP